MNLLRAFSEQFRFFPPNVDVVEEGPGVEHPDGASAQPNPSDQLLGTEIPHCCFYCSWCASQILLPHDSLGFVFGGPAIRKIEARAIATVCRSCARVGAYSLFRGSPGYNTRHKFTPSLPVGRTMLLDWLPCVEGSCVFSLPFFVTFDDDLSEENVKRRAAQWLWDDVTCPVGHLVQPPEWLFGPGPHRGALDLNRVGVQRLL